MEILDHYLPRPEFNLSPEKQSAFENMWDATRHGERFDYHLPYPKWQFLSYLCETKPVILHGSQLSGIDVVQPQQANDIRAFANQRAIYATSDGIWVIYFAILDRKNHPMSLYNACFRFQDADDHWSYPFYFFSISQSALLKAPWISGTIYILPRESFHKEPNQPIMGVTVDFPHWISASPAQPLAKLTVSPEDFPFLAQIHGHDDYLLNKLVKENPDGFPWPEALIS
jgi:hypothetical protein